MAFNINDMRSQFTFGGAQASQFQVQIQNPVNGSGDLKVPFMVSAAQIPESTLGTIEVPYFGRKVKLPGDRTFAEWTVTVMNDEDFLIRNAMENWMHSINSHEENIREFGSASPSQFKSQAQIHQYSKTGTILRTYNFVGLWPSSVSNIQMDWNTTDDFERFDITFQYDWWTVTGGITGNAGTQ